MLKEIYRSMVITNKYTDIWIYILLIVHYLQVICVKIAIPFFDYLFKLIEIICLMGAKKSNICMI